jgi:transposase-like protein
MRNDYKIDRGVSRVFSVEFKQKKVSEIERGVTRIGEICKEYCVSDAAVRKWIKAYGIMKKKKERLIVESASDTQMIIKLKQQIAELQRAVGEKQIELDFKSKMIDIAEEMYGVDIKKKFGSQPFSGSGTTAKS